MIIKMTLVGESSSEGIFECTEEQFKFLQYVQESQGNQLEESYCPSIYFDKVENKNGNV